MQVLVRTGAEGGGLTAWGSHLSQFCTVHESHALYFLKNGFFLNLWQWQKGLLSGGQVQIAEEGSKSCISCQMDDWVVKPVIQMDSTLPWSGLGLVTPGSSAYVYYPHAQP